MSPLVESTPAPASAGASPVFAPATRPRDRAATRLLSVGAGRHRDGMLADLPDQLRPGDLVVLNDAATLPASLRVHDPAWVSDPRTSTPPTLELRLAEAPDARGRARAVLFGAGSWRHRTEDRPAPPHLRPGARLVAVEVPALVAHVEAVDALSPRLLHVRFGGPHDRRDAALYHAARPIQYAYLESELPLWAVQTAYAARPWAVEPASAGLGLTGGLLLALRQRGIDIATITHAAGLSATGDPAIDGALPLPERSDVPAATVRCVAAAQARGGRVIAVGTSVVRALEGRVADAGALVAGQRITAYKLGPHTPRRVVDGLLTGMHAPGESHHALLGAFLDGPALAGATAHAMARGYLAHELGDAMLVLP